VLAIDLRGHGASAKPACCYAYADLAHDLSAFLDAKGVKRASVVGHSLGSIAAQVLAAHEPGRVDKLVLIGSTNRPMMARGDAYWTAVMALQDPIDPNGAFIQEHQSNPNPVDPVFHGHVVRESAAVPASVWRGVVRELVTSEFGRLSAEVRAPTLILWGDKDPLVDAQHQETLRAALPHARFRAYPGLGHNPHWEQPAQVGADIAAFLRERPTSVSLKERPAYASSKR
jgi:pimeloyl-ACP methyl ester carboxylesterase